MTTPARLPPEVLEELRTLRALAASVRRYVDSLEYGPYEESRKFRALNDMLETYEASVEPGRNWSNNYTLESIK